MSIQVEVTYDMSKVLGCRRFEVESAKTVREVVDETAARFDGGDDFAKLARLTAIAVKHVSTAITDRMIELWWMSLVR